MRIRDPKTTALIFASGKMVVTGAKSEDDSKLASRKYALIIQKLGFNAKFTDFKIQNIVGSCDIKFPIRLEGLASRHHHFSSYEPELFPGLIYRMIKPKIVLLIFVSGKIVLTGAKVREEIYQAFEMIYPVLSGEWDGIALPTFLADIGRLPESMNYFPRTSSPEVDHPTRCITNIFQFFCTNTYTTFSLYGVTIHPPSRQASTADTQVLPLMHISLYGWLLLCCRYNMFPFATLWCLHLHGVFFFELLGLDTDCLMHLERSHYADYVGGTCAGR